MITKTSKPSIRLALDDRRAASENRRAPDWRIFGRGEAQALKKGSKALKPGPALHEAGKVGKRGTIVIPAAMRRRLGIEEGSWVIAEERPEGVLIRPAVVTPVELYTPERKAEFLLNNAVDADDYAAARERVRAMGLDPDRVTHMKPPGS
jgi:AbrB family looped-hinge helix DNA binding protein